MGYGDEIMAAGEAKRLQDVGDPRPVAILDRHGRPRWHGLWEGNPRIARPGDVAHGLDVQRIVNGPRCRPYVDYARMEREFNAACPGRPYDIKIVDAKFPWRYTDWRTTPGELCCVERLKPRGYIVVEPNVKGSFTANKDGAGGAGKPWCAGSTATGCSSDRRAPGYSRASGISKRRRSSMPAGCFRARVRRSCPRAGCTMRRRP